MAFDNANPNYFEACGIADKKVELLAAVEALPYKVENSSHMTELMTLAGDDVIKNAAIVCAYFKKTNL